MLFQALENPEDGSTQPETKKYVYKPREVPIEAMTFGLSREDLDEKIIAEVNPFYSITDLSVFEDLLILIYCSYRCT